jgi:hypothetical protein
VYDWLLFFHLIAAFLLAVTAVTYSAAALGAAGGRTLFVADRCWDVGGIGTLIFGVWLALYLDQYEIWDGWIIGAIVLWLVTIGIGDGVRRQLAESGSGVAGDDGGTTVVKLESRLALMHWLRTLGVIGLLVLMVWKPGA